MKRIHELDALRGIALFGILLVNIFVFHAPYSYYGQLNPTDLVIIAIVIFAFSIIFSTFWLKNRNMGPLEHLWRKLNGESK